MFSKLFPRAHKIIRRINTNLIKKAGRSPEIIYYDVTNFYFEIENPDEDTLDEKGNVIAKGQRKMRVCKEEQNLDGLDFSRFILIADRGICNYRNLLHVLDAGNGYIVSKSLLKSTKKNRNGLTVTMVTPQPATISNISPGL